MAVCYSPGCANAGLQCWNTGENTKKTSRIKCTSQCLTLVLTLLGMPLLMRADDCGKHGIECSSDACCAYLYL